MAIFPALQKLTHMSTCKISFNKCSTYMARAAVLSTFSFSTLFWRSTATADSAKSLTGIPITCLLAPPSLLLKSISAIKESREVRLEAALVFAPLEELEEFFKVSTFFLTGLLSCPSHWWKRRLASWTFPLASWGTTSWQGSSWRMACQSFSS